MVDIKKQIPMEFRHAYSPQKRVSISFSPYTESMVHPEFQDECNIDTIIRRFKKSGILTHVKQVQGQYGDFCSMPQYHEAMNMVATANSMFESLPADVRSKFRNDPAVFLDFAQNPFNASEMQSMGLIPKPIEKPLQSGLNVSNDVSKPDSSSAGSAT